MEPTVFTYAGLSLLLAKILEDSAGTAEVLEGAKLKLFINDVDPGVNATLTDFDLATFTGSTAITVAAWGEVFRATTGNPTVLGSLAQWDWDSGDAETVYGVVLTDGADALLGYARLANEKTMDGTDDSLAIVPRIEMGATGFGTFERIAA